MHVSFYTKQAYIYIYTHTHIYSDILHRKTEIKIQREREREAQTCTKMHNPYTYKIVDTPLLELIILKFLGFCVSKPNTWFPLRKLNKKNPSIFLGSFIAVNHSSFPLCSNVLAIMVVNYWPL